MEITSSITTINLPCPTSLTIPHPLNKELSLVPKMLWWLHTHTHTQLVFIAGQGNLSSKFPAVVCLPILLSEHYTAECQMSRWWPCSSNVSIQSSSIFDHLRWESSLHVEENCGNFYPCWAAQLIALGCNYTYEWHRRHVSDDLLRCNFSSLKTLLKAQWNTNCLLLSFNAISLGNELEETSGF